MRATLGFAFDNLAPAEAEAWRAAFSEGGRTVYVSMDIGANGSAGREFLIVDLRVATVEAALRSATEAVSSGVSDAIVFFRSVATAARFAVVGVARWFGKAPAQPPELASAGVSKRVE